MTYKSVFSGSRYNRRSDTLSVTNQSLLLLRQTQPQSLQTKTTFSGLHCSKHRAKLWLPSMGSSSAVEFETPFSLMIPHILGYSRCLLFRVGCQCIRLSPRFKTRQRLFNIDFYDDFERHVPYPLGGGQISCFTVGQVTRRRPLRRIGIHPLRKG